MLAEYLKEMDGVETIELADGFIAYRINGDECFISDVFVRKEARGKGIYQELGNTVIALAKKAGCKTVRCEVWTDLMDATLSLRAVLSFGCKVVGARPNRIDLVKEL